MNPGGGGIRIDILVGDTGEGSVVGREGSLKGWCAQPLPFTCPAPQHIQVTLDLSRTPISHFRNYSHPRYSAVHYLLSSSTPSR